MSQHRPMLGAHVGVSAVKPGKPAGLLLNRDLVGILSAIGIVLALVLVTVLVAGSGANVLHVLVKWTPFIAKGFGLNVMMSIFAIGCGTLGGILLGMGQLAPSRWISAPSVAATQIFRNAPWLVLLFYCIFILPYQIDFAGQTYTIPSWLRAAIGFTIPVIANFAEILRGAVQSIPSGQWEAAQSLGYPWRKTMMFIVLPQCIKRMLPPWMNLYAILLMATPLASIVGVQEAMMNTQAALQAESQGGLLLPMYAYLLSWFFIYCYPIARISLALEKRFEFR